MGRADYEGCLAAMRLANGLLFPLPVTLPAETPIAAGSEVELTHPRGDVLATLDVEESFEIDPEREAQVLLGSTDPAHPYVRELMAGPKWRLAGRLTQVRPVPHEDSRTFV